MNQTNMVERCDVCQRDVQGEFVIEEVMDGDIPGVKVSRTPDCDYIICDACCKLVCTDCGSLERGYCVECCNRW
jgi:hypothetical protein